MRLLCLLVYLLIAFVVCTAKAEQVINLQLQTGDDNPVRTSTTPIVNDDGTVTLYLLPASFCPKLPNDHVVSARVEDAAGFMPDGAPVAIEPYHGCYQLRVSIKRTCSVSDNECLIAAPILVATTVLNATVQTMQLHLQVEGTDWNWMPRLCTERKSSPVTVCPSPGKAYVRLIANVSKLPKDVVADFSLAPVTSEGRTCASVSGSFSFPPSIETYGFGFSKLKFRCEEKFADIKITEYIVDIK